ncbi:MgtC/SapB family protein [Alteromonas ponticola]|uniref:Protein MgtC n=1 Tax=Alteromonas aquimaris TaxID=2998417 RepID=A0ABT3P681_9ALTE|nr:MgtC/SapB family protein [Alteromonas aquimaris]MCW8108267.1 MgtC/SapB family protein [Alteromonas aquimaris]
MDLQQIFYHFYQLGIAFVLALPIAFNREHSANGAGLRTFPLVAISACAFMLVGRDVYEDGEAEARVMYGIVTGIGFIGGGAILKTSKYVVGTATAAGIWLVGALGVSVAYARYEISIVLSIMGFIIFQFAEPMKKQNQSDEV